MIVASINFLYIVKMIADKISHSAKSACIILRCNWIWHNNYSITFLGDKEPVKLSGRIVDSDMHDVGRFLNRLLGVPPDVQNLYVESWLYADTLLLWCKSCNTNLGVWNRLFELFVSILDLLVQNARLEGHFDSGIADIRANTIELKGPPKVQLCFCSY